MVARIFIIVFFVWVVSGCSGNDGQDAEKFERHMKQAQAYEKQGQYRAAMLEARNAYKASNGDDAAAIILARIYNDTGAFSQTIRLLEPRSERSVESNLLLIKAYNAAKKHHTASKLLDSISPDTLAPEQQSDYWKLYAETYLFLNKPGQVDRAVTALSEPGFAPELMHYIKAAQALALQDVVQAKASLSKALAANAKFFDALALSGDIALHDNDLSAAEKYYMDAYAVLPSTDVPSAERVVLLRRIIETLIQLGRSAEALRYQKILADLNPESYEAQQQFSEALELYSQGDLDGANKILSALREKYPHDKNSATLLGLVAQKQQNFQLADELFSEFLDTETAAPSVMQAATIAKLSMNKSAEALEMLARAAEDQPDNAGILAVYGLALIEAGNQEHKAIMTLERSLALNEKQSRIRVALANLYFANGNDEQGLAQLKKAYSLNDADMLVQQAYYRALLRAGEVTSLKQEIKAFASKYPESGRPEFYLGLLAAAEKNSGSALKHFEQSLAKKDSSIAPLIHAAIAQIEAGKGNYVQATKAWEDAIVARPQSLKSYAQWLNMLKRRGQLATAAERLDQLSIADDIWQKHYTLSRIAGWNGDPEEAIRQVELALKLKPSLPLLHQYGAVLYQRQGFSYYAKGDISSARKSLLKASSLMPGNVAFVANLVKLELSAGNNEAAQNILDQFKSNNDDVAAQQYLQGQIYQNSGAEDKAFAAYKASWDAHPTDLAGDALWRLYRGSEPDMRAHIADWQKRLPESHKPVLYLAMLEQSKGDNAKAKRLYERVLELQPEAPIALNNLSWIYLEENNPRAIELAEKALDLAPNSPSVIDTLGWVLVQNGRIEEGYEYLQRAQALAPENKEIESHLKAAKAQL